MLLVGIKLVIYDFKSKFFTNVWANVEIVIIIKEPTITNKSVTGRGDINKCFGGQGGSMS